MKELVQVIASALVDHPEEVVVTETETEKAIVVELRVAADDMRNNFVQHTLYEVIRCMIWYDKDKEHVFCRFQEVLLLHQRQTDNHHIKNNRCLDDLDIRSKL